MALPASAEAGKLFDFNLTLPISEWCCYSRSSNSSISDVEVLHSGAAPKAISSVWSEHGGCQADIRRYQLCAVMIGMAATAATAAVVAHAAQPCALPYLAHLVKCTHTYTVIVFHMCSTC
jgi:hypothetical protein